MLKIILSKHLSCTLIAILIASLFSISTASSRSGEWEGFSKTDSYLDCGYSTNEVPFSMKIQNDQFSAITQDADGQLSFDGRITTNKIDQIIMLTVQTSASRNNVQGRFKGYFANDNLFLGSIEGSADKDAQNGEGAYCQTSVELTLKKGTRKKITIEEYPLSKMKTVKEVCPLSKVYLKRV